MASVTCVVHHGEVDDSDAIELPGGWACTKCYQWMESLVDDEDDDDYELVIITFDGDVDLL